MRKEIVIVEMGDDNTYSAYPKTIKDTIIGEGATADEAIKDFYNSYNEIVECYKNEGSVPDYLKDVEFVFQIQQEGC